MREARDTSAQAELPAKREAFLTALRGLADAADAVLSAWGDLDRRVPIRGAGRALRVESYETVEYPTNWRSLDDEVLHIRAWYEAVQKQLGGAS